MGDTGNQPGPAGRPSGMKRRALVLSAVVAFAVAVAALAVVAGGPERGKLVKLPVAALGGGSEDQATARSSLAYPDLGAVQYRVEGRLPELPSTAAAYRLGSDADRSQIERLARALGLDGDVVEEGGGWAVRDGDRQLRVERAPGLPWYLGSACPDATVSSHGREGITSCDASKIAVDQGGGAGSVGPSRPGPIEPQPACAPDAGACSEPAAEPPNPPAPTPPAAQPPPAPPAVAAPTRPACKAGTTECSPNGSEPAPPVPASAPDPGQAPNTLVPPDVAPPEKPARPADLASREEAERLAREIFERLGLGLDGLVVEDGYLTWEARVEPTVDGLPVIGFGHSVSIGAKNALVRANGFLDRPDRIGEYPLAGVEEGLRRLRQGVGIGPRPLIAEDQPSFPVGAEPAIGDCSRPTVHCDPPPAGLPTTVPSEPPPAQVRTITGVHLALLHVGTTLQPVYVFELEGGDETHPVPAVTAEWLEGEVQGEVPVTKD